MKYRCASTWIYLLAFLMVVPLVGCVPAATVEWKISSKSGTVAMAHDVQRVREILLRIGYSKLAPGTNADALPRADFFVSIKSQRLNIALSWDSQDSVLVKLSEGGEAKLSALGLQEIESISAEFEREFGKSRVSSQKNQ